MKEEGPVKGYPDPQTRDLGLYIHVPFCRLRCHFCSFYLIPHEEQHVEQFILALKKEIALYATLGGIAQRPVRTVYFGGGTPMVLSSHGFSHIWDGLVEGFDLVRDCEVTVEATPESLTREKIDGLIRAGTTRVSVGVQSFNAQERAKLGLSGTLEKVREGLTLLKDCGMKNVNLDLIYGIPGQTRTSWVQTLEQACSVEPTHLSCYALSWEEGTRFYKELSQGTLTEIDVEEEEKFQGLTEEILQGSGFCQYEISNWAQPDFSCQHNQRYWLGQDYLGLGPSAQSYVSGCRFGNVPSLQGYCRALSRNEFPVEKQERLSAFQQEKEQVVFGLRMLKGVSLNKVPGVVNNLDWRRSVNTLVKEGFLSATSSTLALTGKGRQFADRVGMELW